MSVLFAMLTVGPVLMSDSLLLAVSPLPESEEEETESSTQSESFGDLR